MDHNLFSYTLHLADNALILSQRNSEWTGHGPVLEQDIAISNIALDLIGQARLFYQYAARIQGGAAKEDDLAFLRDSWDFKNCLLVELEKGDWAKTTLRQFFFSTYQYYLYKLLLESSDKELAAISGKALKEVTYHLRWSAEWVIRLGDGTEESHRRISLALNDLWRYTGELITACPYETVLACEKIAADINIVKAGWLDKVREVLEEATLQIPGETWMQEGGKQGRHTESLGYLLAEMQYLQRTYPNCEW
jgi:ring-1,2-phenylacetyl-CoA epoxidase subunit PaaC